MSNRMDVEEIVLFLVVHAQEELSVTKLMKLVFLADVEHQQVYGEPLSDVEWSYYHFGPFTPLLYTAAESLEDEGLITCTIRPAFTDKGRNYSPAVGDVDARLERLGPRARRMLSGVLKRYGHLSGQQIKRIAYETDTMRAARQGERLDLSQEPRRMPSARIPGLAALKGRAPAPIVRDIGDPEASAEEDLAILGELGRLRREANRELG